MPIRILIVDDHAVVRQGLRIFLGLDQELEIVGEAADGEQAISLARELRPDVVLMDLLMPALDGIAATAAIRRELPDTEVIAMTSVVEYKAVTGAMQAGAIGYLLKDTEAPELCRAIKAAAAGQVQLSSKMAARLLREITLPSTRESLTEREMDVLMAMAKGYANKEIGQNLNISIPTVKKHVTSVLAKLGLSSRTQAVLYAIRMGLVSPGNPGPA
jgi:two-component system, NarL family, response regulator LiaR